MYFILIFFFARNRVVNFLAKSYNHDKNTIKTKDSKSD